MRLIALFTLIAVPPVALAAGPMPGQLPPTNGQIIGNAITQPLADVNLFKRPLSNELMKAADDPYALTGSGNCREIIGAIAALDAVLGPDIDQIEINPRDRKRREGAASVAGGLVSALIPFRFLIREVSGAAAHDRQKRAIVYAGVVRRSFLKGLGMQRRCRVPGRPLTRLESASNAAKTVMGEVHAK